MFKKVFKSFIRINLAVYFVIFCFFAYFYGNIWIYESGKKYFIKNAELVNSDLKDAIEFGRYYSYIGNKHYNENLPEIGKEELENILNGGSSGTYKSPFSKNNIVNIYEREIPVGMDFLPHLFYKTFNQFVDRSDKVYAQRFFIPFTDRKMENSPNIIRVGLDDLEYVRMLMGYYSVDRDKAGALVLLHEIAHTHPLQKVKVNDVWMGLVDKKRVDLELEAMADIMSLLALKKIYKIEDDEFIKIINAQIDMRSISAGREVHLTSAPLYVFREHYIKNRVFYNNIALEDVAIVALLISGFGYDYNYAKMLNNVNGTDFEYIDYYDFAIELNRRPLTIKNIKPLDMLQHFDNYVEIEVSNYKY